MSHMIEISGLTKTFAGGKGIFDLNLTVREGEVFGYLGPNGAGKSTTIRHLMGYMKPDRGSSRIAGKDCWNQAPAIHSRVGYLPGEIAFMEGIDGLEFLNLMSGMRGMKDNKRRDDLIERFQFDIKTPIRKMSKGMKQKVGIVAAFMHDPDILILDEPTSGLDPLMQRLFIDLILEEKARGKTVLMSSHIFQEVDRTCDRVAILKEGRLMAEKNVADLVLVQRRLFDVVLASKEAAAALSHSGLEVSKCEGVRVRVAVQGDYNLFLRELSQYDVLSLDVHELDLEEIFMHYYDREETL